MEKTKRLTRCTWSRDDALLIHYHDKEWGVPVTKDDLLFEALTLEVFQAGLSWSTILHKREHFRKAFDCFDIIHVADYGEDKIDQLLTNKGIVRHRGKIEATIHNASVSQELIQQFGSLQLYFQSLPDFEKEKQVHIKRTFKRVGLTTAKSFLMAVGYIDPTHEAGCFLNAMNHN